MMTVMWVSGPQSETNVADPSRAIGRVRAMPCELIECYSAEDVRQCLATSDAVLLPGENTSWPAFWNEVADLVETMPFVGIFSADSYKTIWIEGRKSIRFWAVLPSMLTIYKMRAHLLGHDCGAVFWSPCCVDVQPEAAARDIDVLFWGNPGLRHYPFRNFVLRELTRHSYVERIEGGLIVNDLQLDGEHYRYARIPYANTGFWGNDLYPAISRARICCTGSAFCQAPVARYFQNAACGCLTLTNEFTDQEELGFIHGENIWNTDEHHFTDDLVALLKDPDAVSRMGENARKLISERHTVAIRASELYGFMEEAIS